MHPVYHAKITVSTKNFTRSEGRKCGVKGLVQWRGLMIWSRSWFRTTGKGTRKGESVGILEFTTLDDEIPGPSITCSGAFDENCPETDPQFPPWECSALGCIVD